MVRLSHNSSMCDKTHLYALLGIHILAREMRHVSFTGISYQRLLHMWHDSAICDITCFCVTNLVTNRWHHSVAHLKIKKIHTLVTWNYTYTQTHTLKHTNIHFCPLSMSHVYNNSGWSPASLHLLIPRPFVGPSSSWQRRSLEGHPQFNCQC